MKIKKGDNVIVIAGKDRGKTGKILRAFPERNTVIIEGINVKKKHQRPNRKTQKGQIIEIALPLHVSNVQLADPKSGKPTRISYKVEKGKKMRVAKRSGSLI
jgi:large subunit ribosomal protein L24